MAVNSKADKTGGHKVKSLVPGQAPLAPTPFSSKAPPIVGGAISQMGGKALGMRAKKVLSPLEDPNQAPTE